MIQGGEITLRSATGDDIPALAEIRATPEVYRRWRGDFDMASSVATDLADPERHTLVIEYNNRVVGAIQWAEETDPDYRHANLEPLNMRF